MNTPIPAFKFAFQITLEGVSEDSNAEYFYAVEGLGLSYQTERFLPGGYNKSYNLPMLYETDQLVFKRPLLQGKSNITKWCEQALDTSVFKPTIAHIFVLNKDQSIHTHWAAEQIYPIGIKYSTLDLESGNPVVLEIMTLAYSRLNRVV